MLLLVDEFTARSMDDRLFCETMRCAMDTTPSLVICMAPAPLPPELSFSAPRNISLCMSDQLLRRGKLAFVENESGVVKHDLA